MKRFLLSTLLCTLGGLVQATTYHNITSTNLQNTSSWSDGVGNPANFSTAGDVFILDFGSTGSISGAWALTDVALNIGSGSAMTLTIASGANSLSTSGSAVVNMSANAVLNIANTTIPAFGTLNASSTVNYNNATGGQSIAAAAYGNLTTSNTSGTETLAGNASCNTLTLTSSGGTFADNGNTISVSGNLAGAGKHTGSGKISLTGNGSIAVLTTLGNIEINTAGVISLAGSVSVNAALAFTSGSLSIGANTLTFATGAAVTGMSSTNTLICNGTSSAIITSSTGSIGTLYFDLSTPGTSNKITTFTCSGSGGTTTLGTDIYVGTLALSNAAATLADGGNIINMTGNITGTGKHTGSGKIYLTNSSSTITGISTGNIELNNASGFALAGSPTVTGVMTFTSGALTVASTYTLTVGAGGSLSGMSVAKCFTGGSATSGIAVSNTTDIGTIYFDQTTPGTSNKFGYLGATASGAAVTLGNDVYVANTLSVANANATIADGGNTIYLAGNISGSGKHTGTGKILMAGGAGVQTISNIGASGNIEFNNSNGFQLLSSPTITGTLTFTSGKLILGNFGLSFTTGTVSTMSGTNCFVCNGLSTISITNPSFADTIYFDQTTPGTTNKLTTLTINNATADVFTGNNLNVISLTLTTGKIEDLGNTITVTGNVTGAGTHSSTGSGKISMNGSSAQQVSNITADNLEINNSAGVSLSANTIVTGNLAFTTGKLGIGTSHILTLKGTVSGMSASNCITGGTTSSLTINTSGTLGTIYLDQSAVGTSNNITTFTNTLGTTTLGNAMQTGSLVLTAGTVNDGGNTITLTGNITGTGTHTGTGKITMNGTTKTISAVTLGNLELNCASSTAYSLSGSATINGTLTFTGSGNTLTVGSNTLTINGAVSGMSATKYMTGSASSNLTIGIAGAIGTMFFSQTNAGTTNNFSNFTLNNGGNLTMGNSLSVGNLSLTTGTIALNDNNLTIKSTFSGGASSYLTGSASSSFTTTATTLGTLYWDQTTPGVSNNVATFTNTSGTTTLGNNLTIGTTLALTAGTINDNGNIITLAGNITGTGTHTSGTGGQISMTGQNKSISGVTLGNLELNYGSGASAYTLGGNVTVNGALTFTGANNTLTMGANTLSLKGSVSGMSATKYFTGSASSNLTINTAGTLGTVYFNQTTPGTTNYVATFTHTAGSTTLGSNVSTGTLALTSGTLNDGGNIITLTGNITGTGTHTGSGKITMTGLAKSISGVTLGNLELNYSSGASAFTLTGSPTVNGSFTITGASNTFTVGANTLTLNGAVSGMSATKYFTGSATSNITFGGSGAIGPVYFNPTTPGTTNNFLNFVLNGGATLTMGNSLSAANLALTSGILSINNNGLTVKTSFTGDAANYLTGSASSTFTTSASGTLGTLYWDQTTPGTSNKVNTFTNTSGATTLGNDLAIGTTLTLTAGSLNDNGNTITLAGNIAGSGTHTSTGAGKISMTGLSKSISGATLGNLDLNYSSGASIFSLSGSATINGTLSFTGASNTLTIGSNTLALNGQVSGMSATKYITGSNSTILSIGTTGSLGTLMFDQTSAATRSVATLNMLGAGDATTGSLLNVVNTLNLAAGTLYDGGNTITVQGDITGTATHSSTGSGKISATGTNKNISGATFGNLELNAAGTSAYVLTGSPTINGALTITGTNNTLTIGSNTLTLNGTVSGMSGTKYLTGSTNAVLTVGATSALGTIYMNPATPGTTNNFASVTISGTGGTTTLGNALSISGNLNLTAGTLADNGQTVTLAGSITGTATHSGAGKIQMTGTSSTISGATLGNVEFAGTASSFALSGSPVINGTLTFTNAANTLAIGNNTLTLNGQVASMSSSKYFTGSSLSKIIIGAAGNAGTLYFNPTTLGTSNNMTSFCITGGGSATLGNNLSVSTTLALTSGTINDGGNTIALSGNITGTGTHTGSGAINMTGTGVSISGVTLGNLTLSNNTTVGLTADPTINGTLTFTSGKLTTGTNNLIMGASAAVAGTPSSSNMIVATGSGQVRKLMTGAGSFTYPIGDGTNYTPMNINMASGTFGGGAYIGTSVTGSKHGANASTSGYLNRYWTVQTSGITSPVYSVTATYVPGDVTPSEASMYMAQYSGSLPWNVYSPANTVSHTISTTNIGTTGIAYYTGLNGGVPTVTVNATTAAICPGGAATLTASGNGYPTVSYTWAPSAGLSATTGTSVTATPTITTVYTVTITDGNGQTGTATTSIAVNAQPTVSISTALVGNLCPTVIETLNATPSGGAGTASYTWSGPGISSPTGSGSVPTFTVIPSPAFSMIPTNAAGAYTVTLSYSGTGCNSASDVSSVITPALHQWAGGDSGAPTDWNTATNWVCGGVPVVSDDILIPSAANQPTILAGATNSLHSLYIDSGVTLTVSNSATLNVTGNLKNNGNITGSGSGNVVLSGSSAQTLSGKGCVYNLELKNSAGATINSSNDTVTIKNALTLTLGTLTTSNTLMLYSNASGTARIATITGGSISGNVISQQYFPGGRRAMRFFGHPYSTYIPLSQLQNYMDITGSGGASNGFTDSYTDNPSAYWYDTRYANSDLASDPGYMAFTNANANVDTNRFKRYQGIRLLIRGAKGEGISTNIYTPSPVTVRTWGPVNTGNQSIPLVKGAAASGQDFNQISNPYPSPVDIGTVVKTAYDAGNIAGVNMFIWNPYLGSQGAYQNVAISNTPYYLQANASFFIRAKNNGVTLDFTEANKSSSVTTQILRPEAEKNTALYVYDGGYHTWDMLYFDFNDKATASEDNDFDAVKPTNPAGVNFYSVSDDNQHMMLDGRPYVSHTTIPLGFTSDCQQDFIIRAEQMNTPIGSKVYLHDKYARKYTLMDKAAEYHFLVSAEAASQGKDRFELRLDPTQEEMTEKSLEMTMVPNPAADEVTINFTSEGTDNTRVNVTDIKGVVIYNDDLGIQAKGSVKVPLSNLAPGIYLVTITSGNNRIISRLVKE